MLDSLDLILLTKSGYLYSLQSGLILETSMGKYCSSIILGLLLKKLVFVQSC